MYCGTNKTALQSQKQTAASMMSLLEKKQFSQITISELCKTAGISRQTFYSLFTSKEDVIQFALRAQYCEAPDISVPAHTAGKDALLRQLCGSYSRFIWRNRSLIKILVDNQIDYLLYDTFFNAMACCGAFLEEAGSSMRRFAASFYAGGFACAARHFAEEGCLTGPEDLTEILMTLLSGRLF